MARVTIFHTSDLHNSLTARLAGHLRQLKAGSPESLLLDSGDAIWAGNIFWRPGGEPILDLMNSIPYDAMTLGNREFHFLLHGLISKTSRAAFPILSANLRGVGGRGLGAREGEAREGEAREGEAREGEAREGEAPSEPCGVRTHIAFDRVGLRIAIFGLSVPCITERMLVKRVSDFYFDQPINAARELVPRLRRDCDLLIALTHIGIKADRELAEVVPGIDIIFGGHTHTITDPEERVGGTWILHHGHHGHHVRRVEIDTDDGIRVRNELIPLGEA